MNSTKPIIAITMGDPGGSGPEIDLKVVRNDEIRSKANLLLIGDFKTFEKASVTTGTRNLKLRKIADPSEMVDESSTINILDLGNVDFSKLVYGKASALGGRASYECIAKAVACAIAGDVHAIVTAPISKESLNLAGYHYPGHTELLADLTHTKEVKMMLVAGSFKVTHVTTHVSMRKALDLIKKERVLNTIELTYQSLVNLFGIPQPKIAISGLNPHAGENGLFGDEEINEISPAISEACSRGMGVLGPFPPDTVFYRAYYKKKMDVDAVIAMYHDQGHIAMKMVGFMDGVNMSLGLPIIRTSPDHGTVWGKAGQGIADENATAEATKLAIELANKKFKLIK